MFGGLSNIGGGVGANDVVAFVGVHGVERFIQEFKRMDRTVVRFSTSFRESMGTLVKAYGAVIAGAAALGTAMVGVARQAATFEKGMANVYTLLDISDKQMRALSRGVLELSKRLPQSADKLSTALYDLVSAGVDAGHALKTLELASKAAVAGVTDAQTAVRAGMSVINAYGMSLDELNRVYDVQFKTVNKGMLVYEQLANAIGNVLPAATALGAKIEDLFAGISELTLAAQSADEAATNLSRLFQSFVEQQEKFKELGIDIFDSYGRFRGLIPIIDDLSKVMAGLTDQERQAVLEILNLDIRAGRALNSFIKNSQRLKKTFEEIKDSSGAMNAAFQKIDATTISQYDRLKSSLEVLAITLGDKLLPAINDALKPLTEFVDTITIIVESKTFDKLIKQIMSFAKNLYNVATYFYPIINLFDIAKNIVHQSIVGKGIYDNFMELQPLQAHTPSVSGPGPLQITDDDIARIQNYITKTQKLTEIMRNVPQQKDIKLRVKLPANLDESIQYIQKSFNNINFDSFDSSIADIMDSINQMGLTTQNIAMTIQASIYKLSSRIVDAMYDAKTQFKDIWEGIAKDFLNLFVQEILKHVALLAAKILMNLTLFDVYENDRMAERVGRDYAKYFSKGVINELTKNINPNIINNLIAPEIVSINSLDKSGTIKVEVETIPIEEHRVRAYFQRVNREVLIPDQRYVEQFLTTEKTEFDE